MLVGSVVIVTYNSAQCVQTCMRALGSAAGWETVLVDNASSDGTVEIVRRVAPNIRVLRNPNNRGFAAAVNQGIKAAAGEIAVILNPDTVATEGALDRLARVLAGDSKAGAVGGSLRKRDGLVERGFTVRRFPTLGSAIAEALLLNRAWGNNPWNRRYRCLDLDYNRLQEVDQ